MKNNLLKASCILLVILLVITACQKNVSEKISSISDSQSKSAISRQSNNSGCKLVYEEFPNGNTETFTYNSDGWVDKFHQSSPAYSADARLSYLPNGHISRADVHWIAYAGKIKEYALFTYQGNNISKVSYYNAATDELDVEIMVTYNANDQVTRFDLPIYNMYQKYYYDAIGDPSRYEFYVDNFLTAYINYGHTKYIKNPELLLVSSGLSFDFMTPFIQDFPQLASGRSAYYWDEGTSSYVQWLSCLPQNTTVTTNSFGNPESVKMFNEVTGKEIKLMYNYTNCGSGNQNQSNQSFQTDDSNNDEGILSKAERLKIIKDVMMATMHGTYKTK